MISNNYLIYSYEHKAWWKPGKRGYSEDIGEAGVYSFEYAVEICKSANLHTYSPNEVMIHLNFLSKIV